MLNDGDSNHGGGEVKDAEALFSKLKRNIKADYNSKGQVNWRKEAREDFDSTPANSSMRTTRQFCRTQSTRSSFSTA
jgi:hypothetical protein